MGPGQKKAATSAQEDGGDSDEDWSRGGKTSKSKKGGKAKKGVNLLLVLPAKVLGKRKASTCTLSDEQGSISVGALQ